MSTAIGQPGRLCPLICVLLSVVSGPVINKFKSIEWEWGMVVRTSGGWDGKILGLGPAWATHAVRLSETMGNVRA